MYVPPVFVRGHPGEGFQGSAPGDCPEEEVEPAVPLFQEVFSGKLRLFSQMGKQ